MTTPARETVFDAAWAADHLAITSVNRRTLDQVFHHPISRDLTWDDVTGLVRHIGQAEERSKNTFLFKVGRESLELCKPHTHHLTAPEVMNVRNFPSAGGRSPLSHDDVAKSVGA